MRYDKYIRKRTGATEPTKKSGLNTTTHLVCHMIILGRFPPFLELPCIQGRLKSSWDRWSPAACVCRWLRELITKIIYETKNYEMYTTDIRYYCTLIYSLIVGPYCSYIFLLVSLTQLNSYLTLTNRIERYSTAFHTKHTRLIHRNIEIVMGMENILKNLCILKTCVLIICVLINATLLAQCLDRYLLITRCRNQTSDQS